jgi:hypothetical protein
VNLLLTREKAVDASKWNTRGWTYRERLTSTRRLYLTTEQSYFECNNGCNHFEEILSWTKADLKLKPGNALSKPLGTQAVFLGRDEINFNVYARVVFEFTARNLTHSRDALDAVSGVLSQLRPLFGMRRFDFGIPLARFDADLLWKPKGSSRPRLYSESGKPVFPSWSWLGWEGQAQYGEGYGNKVPQKVLNLCETTVSGRSVGMGSFETLPLGGAHSLKTHLSVSQKHISFRKKIRPPYRRHLLRRSLPARP